MNVLRQPVLIGGSAYKPFNLMMPGSYEMRDMRFAKDKLLDDLKSPDAWGELAKAYVNLGYRDHALAAYEVAKRYGELPPWHRDQQSRLVESPHLMMTFDDAEIQGNIEYFVEKFGVFPVRHSRLALGQRWFLIGNDWHIVPYDSNSSGMPVIDGLILQSNQDIVAQPLWQQALDYLYSNICAEIVPQRLRELPTHAELWEKFGEALEAKKLLDHAQGCFEIASQLSPKVRHRILFKSRMKGIVEQTDDLDLAQVIGPEIAKIEKRIGEYFERLRGLSDDGETRLISDRIDFPTNESSFPFVLEDNPKTASYIGAGGTYVGTGTALYLTHMGYQEADHGFVVDCNALVTEGIIPAIGIYLMMSPTPEEFLANLVGVKMTPSLRQELLNKSLLEKYKIIMREPTDNTFHEKLLQSVLSLVLKEIPKKDRPEMVKLLLEEFESFAHNRHTFEVLVVDVMMKTASTGRGGILSSQDAYQSAVKIWREGRVTGVTADWTGPVFKKIAATMKKENLPPVNLLYPSNIPDHLYGDHSEFGETKSSQPFDLAGVLDDLPSADDLPVILMRVGGSNGDVISKQIFRQLLPQPDEDSYNIHRLFNRAEIHRGSWRSFRNELLAILSASEGPQLKNLIKALLEARQHDSLERLNDIVQRKGLNDRNRVRFWYVFNRVIEKDF